MILVYLRKGVVSPTYLIKVLLLLWSTDVNSTYHVVELFSGVGRIAKCFRDAGYKAVEYDFIHGSSMDFLSSAGFLLLGLHLTSARQLHC